MFPCKNLICENFLAMKGQNFPISILKIRLVEFPKHILASTYIKSEMPNFKKNLIIFRKLRTDLQLSDRSDNFERKKRVVP